MNQRKTELRYPDHLVVLLDRATDRIRGDIASRVEWRSLGALRPWHLQLLLTLPPEGARPSDLAAAAGMSRQALSEWIRELATDGYLMVSTDPGDRRNRIVRPTQKAIDAVALVSEAIKAVEADWSDALGHDRFAELRAALLELRDRGDLARP